MYTGFNLSLLNETNLDLYIVPAQERHLDNDFDLYTLNFTWKALSFNNDTLTLGINWTCS